MYEELKNQRAFEVNDLPEEIRSLIGANRALIIPLDDNEKNSTEKKLNLSSIFPDGVGAIKVLDNIGLHLNKICELIDSGETVMLDNLVALYSLYDYATLKANLYIRDYDEQYLDTPTFGEYYNNVLAHFFDNQFDKYIIEVMQFGLTAQFKFKVVKSNGIYGLEVIENSINKKWIGIMEYVKCCKKIGGPIWFKPIDDYLMHLVKNGEIFRNTYEAAINLFYEVEQLRDVYENNIIVYTCTQSKYNLVGIVIEEDKLIDRFEEMYR